MPKRLAEISFSQLIAGLPVVDIVFSSMSIKICSKDSERRGQRQIYLNYAEPPPILSKDSERRGQRQIYLNYADLLLFFVKVIKSGKYDADFKNIMRCGGAVQVFTPE